MKIKNTGGNVKSKIFALLFNFAFERKLLTFGVLLLFLSACKETGFQGGDLTTTFNGIESATALSPYSVQLKWNQSSKYDHFKVYRRGASSSIGTAQFSTYTVTGLNPNTTYEFAVTGVTVADGKEEGLDKFVSVTTFPAFTGITASNMTVSSATRIDLSWDMADPSITYNIYVKAAGSSWDFSAPYVSAVGINSIAVTGLKGGTQYCLYMVAQYQDNSSEPTTQDTSLVDANAPCGVTPSALANVAPVSVTPIVPGLFPWFNIPAGGDETYKYEVFEKSTNALIASQTGSGAFRAFSEVPQGPHTYYVKTTAPNGELAQNDVIIGSSANPQSQSINRGLPDTGGTPIFPDVVSGGKGVQTLGSQIVRGDFNCDGLMDIAVSAPEATPYVDPKHVDKMGAVIVYYNYLPPFDPNTNTQPPPYLKTDVAPSPTATAPNPQLIYYPTSSSNMKLGSQLAVGNINGDCQRLKDPNDPADFDEAGLCNTLYSSYSGTEGKLLNIHSCDDLAIATNPSSTSGQSVFVVFGNKDNGLETASATSFYQTDNYSCDIATNNCSPVKITPNGQSVSQFGQSIALGDFNNDSFDDLAIGATDKTTGLGKVFVLRGRQEGVTPIGAAGSFPVIDSTIYNSVGSYTGSAFTANDQFGDVLSPVYNSRECKNIPGTVQYRPNQPPPSPGFDETKCDDLVIGNPQRNSGKGSIVTCKGNMPLDSASDPQQISSWNCLEQYPSSLSSGANYGASLLSVRNFNAYPLKASQIANPQTVPNVTGALFVGAPKDSPSGVTEAGRVYAYYITPESQDTAVGGLQGILGGVSGTHSVNAINTQACNNMNNNVSTAIGATTLFHCEHQALQTSPLESYAHFGQSLGVLDDLVSLDTRGYHYLAVAAPDRDVTASDGSTVIKDAGTIYIFNPDISTLGTETATRYGNNNPLTCTTGVDCTLYLGGVSPYSVTLLYPLDLNEGAKLGLGGIVGGDFNGDLTFGDVITTAPFSNSSVEEGGEIFVFYSNNGFAPTENNVGLRLTPNISIETNYRFEMAKVIGDVNGDSYQDVMTHIDINGRIQTILFYGSSNGLITTPSPSPTAANMEPLLITLNNDPELGKRFYPVGDINGDSYDDVLLLGKNGSYIYYGGFNGLNTSTAPSIAPIGTNPLLFFQDGNNAITLHKKSDLYADSSIFTVYDVQNQSVGFGDFNGDGFDDFAIGLNNTSFNPDLTEQNGLTFTSGNVGRVVIVYGSSNGPQTNRQTGVTTYTDPNEVTAKPPCDVNNNCKVQLLASSTGTAAAFGFSVVGMPSLEGGSSEDELLISDPQFNSNDGEVYFYKGASTGIPSTKTQTLVPIPNTHTNYTGPHQFGYNMASVGDLNNDGINDVAITAPAKNGSDPGFLYIFYGGPIGGNSAQLGIYGVANYSATEDWKRDNGNGGLEDILLNWQHRDASDPHPQIIRPSGILNSDYFGYGVSAAGDFNNDGYNDVLVNVAAGDFNISGNLTETGFAIMYFGGPNGLQSDSTINIAPDCYGSGSSAICKPYQIYLPDRENYEHLYVSPFASGDFNGDGLPDIILGGRGRSHPSGQAYSTGVLYVIY